MTTTNKAGIITTPIGIKDDVAYSAVLQPDGKIIAAGHSNNGTDNDFALVRYNANGSLDKTFGTNGKLTTNFGFLNESINSVSLQADGKILVAGGYSGGGSNENDFTLARYNSDGSLDTSFDFDGKVTTSFADFKESAFSVLPQADGKIVAAGWSDVTANNNSNFAVVRFNADGSLDTSFDSDGKVNTPIPLGSGDDAQGFRAILQTDGKIVVAGQVWNGLDSDFALIRYNTDGSLDTSFDSDGKVTTAIGSGEDWARAVAIQSDGKILAAGYSKNATDYDFALVRYNANGSLDTSFDSDGKLTTAIGLGDEQARLVALQSDGKILVSGFSANGTDDDFALVRYNTDGTLDTSFDGDGKLTFPIGSGKDRAINVFVQPDKKIVLTGYSNNGTDNDFAIVRLNSDGSLDSSFNGDNLPTGNVYINGVAQQGLTVSITQNLNDDDGMGALSYQWKTNNAVVGTGDSYALTQTDVGKSLTVTANYTDQLGNLESVTSASVSVANVNDLPQGIVGISGTPTQGQLLNVSNNLTDADGLGTVNYQWLANAQPISGATQNSYLLTANEVGKTITVKASYTDLQGTAEIVLSNTTDAVSALTNYPPAGEVLIKGTAKINQMLSASNNLLDANGFATGSAGTISYQWLANGAVISGATGNLYVTTASDAGKSISVQASYTDGLGKLETKNSEALKIEDKTTSVVIKNPIDDTPIKEPEVNPEIEKPVILDILPTLKMPKMPSIKINGRTIAKDARDNKILGEGKNDKLSGLAGNDTLLGNAGDDVLDGGKGNDLLDAGNGNDQLLGGDGNDKLLAGSGNDWLDSGKGNDKLNGDLGNDVLIGGEGVDTMEGGDGDDYYVVENVKDVVTETNNNLKVGGNDTVETKLKTFTLGKNVENLLLTELSDSTGNGNELNNQIVGNIGDNSLNGMDGNDQLFGGKGADKLDGGKGMDTLVGGEDDDVYIVQNDEDVIVETENGGEQDQIFSSVDYSLDESPYIEVLTLSGAKAISGMGNEANNLIQEKEGGTTANDFSGGAGNDLLIGEGGNDTLNGGTGNDTLNGGEGSDTVIFNSVENDYQIIRNPDVAGVPQVLVEYVGYGENEGHDELNGIEIIQFSDGDTLNVRELEISTSSAMIISLTGVAAF